MYFEAICFLMESYFICRKLLQEKKSTFASLKFPINSLKFTICLHLIIGDGQVLLNCFSVIVFLLFSYLIAPSSITGIPALCWSLASNHWGTKRRHLGAIFIDRTSNYNRLLRKSFPNEKTVGIKISSAVAHISYPPSLSQATVSWVWKSLPLKGKGKFTVPFRSSPSLLFSDNSRKF